jgi:hypothetical protein
MALLVETVMRYAAVVLVACVVLAGCSGQRTADDPGPGDGVPTPGAGGPPEPSAWRPTWGDVESAPIRPGTAAPGCTFNWLFVDPVEEAYFIGIAAHCVSSEDDTDGTGGRIGNADGADWGTVVFDSDNSTLLADYDVEERVDFALIRLDDGANLEAHPQMMGYEAPVGLAGCEDASEGDLIGWHGYGVVFGDVGATRRREGVLATCDGKDYGAYTNAIFGDSGSAVVHVDSGKAFGIVSRLGMDTFPPTELAGATLPYILSQLSKVPGLQDVRLATIDGGYVGL